MYIQKKEDDMPDPITDTLSKAPKQPGLDGVAFVVRKEMLEVKNEVIALKSEIAKLRKSVDALSPKSTAKEK